MRRITLILLLALAGCAAVPRLPPPPDWPSRRAELQALETWHLNGRVGVAVDGHGGSADIDWRQSGAGSDLAISGPLGIGTLHAALDDNGLRVEDASGTRVEGWRAEAALADRLGVELPLQALRFWLLGVPAPGARAEEHFAADGRPSHFSQAGWEIEMDRYQPVVSGGELPTRVTIWRDSVRLKVVVDRWDLTP